MEMKDKFISLFFKYREILVYLFFGALTTAVNYLVYLPLHSSASMLASVANIIAWVAAVAFAFLTNKPFVFKSKDWSVGTLLPELAKFVGSRISSLIVETLVLFLTVDFAGWNGVIMKLITSVLVVVMNYVTSKFLVFKKDR